MRRKITMLIMAAMLALTMSVGGAGAAFAAKACEPGDPGCKTLEGKNAKFTQTQRGNFNQGTQDTNQCSDPCPPGQFR